MVIAVAMEKTIKRGREKEKEREGADIKEAFACVETVRQIEDAEGPWGTPHLHEKTLESFVLC